MEMRRIGGSPLKTAPIVFGGNVLGWTVNETQAFKILDAFLDAGFNAIDTADTYSRWIPGNKGGESETIIGEWIKSRNARDKVVIITKVGSDMGQGKKDLSAAYIAKAVEAALEANPKAVEDLKGGKKKPEAVKGFLRGQVMKQTGGKANPALVNELLRRKLAG